MGRWKGGGSQKNKRRERERSRESMRTRERITQRKKNEEHGCLGEKKERIGNVKNGETEGKNRESDGISGHERGKRRRI